MKPPVFSAKASAAVFSGDIPSNFHIKYGYASAHFSDATSRLCEICEGMPSWHTPTLLLGTYGHEMTLKPRQARHLAKLLHTFGQTGKLQPPLEEDFSI